jgi:hypothetical protein
MTCPLTLLDSVAANCVYGVPLRDTAPGQALPAYPTLSLYDSAQAAFISPTPRTSSQDVSQIQAVSSSTDFDKVITTKVISLLRALNTGIATTIKQYWRSIHHWLPLFNQHFFDMNSSCFKSRPCAETALLFLHIALLSFPSTSLAINSPYSESTVYHACKSISQRVQQSKGVRSAILKSNILLAAFEVGMCPPISAYLTLKSCASLLLEIRTSLFSGKSPIEISIEDLETCWWVTHMLDRILCVLGDIRRVSTTPALKTDFWSTKEHSSTNFEHHGQSKCPRDMNSFGCEIYYEGYSTTQIRTLCLLDDVVSGQGQSSSKRQILDRCLQQSLFELFERRISDWVLPYSIIVLLLMSVYLECQRFSD